MEYFTFHVLAFGGLRKDTSGINQYKDDGDPEDSGLGKMNLYFVGYVSQRKMF